MRSDAKGAPAKTPRQKKTAGRPRQPAVLVHLEVLQNGATLTRTAVPLRRSGSLLLTSKGDGPLALPHYPLPDGQLEFLRFAGDRVTLVVDYKWEGFCTSKGELINLVRGDRGQRTLTLHKGDYASITYDDLRLLIRLSPPVKPVPQRRGTAREYRKSFLAHFFPTTDERLASLVAAGITAALVGGGAFGLLARPIARPSKLAELSEEYVLPFVSPDHLRYAPEALQTNLDRRQEVRKVFDYYQAATDVLMNWPDDDVSYLYPTTIERYRDLHEEAHATLADKLARQRAVDERQRAAGESVSVLAIPAVLGETMSGSMLRVVDKIGIMDDGFKLNLAARTAMGGGDGAPYAWESYKNPGRKAQGDQSKAKAIANTMRGGPSDEAMMYAEAVALAERAAKKQARLARGAAPGTEAEPGSGGSQSRAALTPALARPVALPDGVKFASFEPEVDFHQADGKFALLSGLPLGVHRSAPPPKVKEPLVGEIEPALIERYIKENRFQLQLCYELALRRNEGATGTMEWRWRIDSRGIISDVALVSTSIQDRRMAECIRQKISQWRFPRPRRGSVEVNYPFDFAPAKG